MMAVKLLNKLQEAYFKLRQRKKIGPGEEPLMQQNFGEFLKMKRFS